MLCWHWYGGPKNSLAQDQDMIQQQASQMAELASNYSIPVVWLTEMQRVNGDQEVSWQQPKAVERKQKLDTIGNKRA